MNAPKDANASLTVTGAEFDQNPRAVYERATNVGPVTVIDSKGQPSMTIVVPRSEGTPSSGE